MIEFLGNKKDHSFIEDKLEQCLHSIADGSKNSWEGIYYRGFPVFFSHDISLNLDGLLCTDSFGVVVFHTVAGTDIPDETLDKSDEVHVKVENKLKELKELTNRRKLILPVTSIIFAPDAKISEDTELFQDFYCCSTQEQIEKVLDNVGQNKGSYFSLVLSRLHSMSNMKPKNKRDYVTKSDSKGAVLKEMERSMASLDINQTKAVLENINGVQRIRGLAGSGKTVVIARKIAHIHSINPEWNIAVTFNSRSLKEQLTRLIENFYFDATNEYPNWNKIKIIHAWGSPRNEGVYFNACKSNNVTYFDFGASKAIKKSKEDNFEAVCRQFLAEVGEFQNIYDLILIDEAQDFSPHFLRICYGLLTEEKRLIYAYDELQNLGDSVMPSPEEIWGLNEKSEPIVRFEEASQDIILDVCYRNPGPVLSAAHALGFGIYSENLIQIFEQSELWSEIGYELIEGELIDDSQVVLARSPHSSPSLLTSHNSTEDLIVFKQFENVDVEAEWLAEQIELNIKEEEILPSDIVVIQPDTMRMQDKVGKVRSLLFDKGINSSIAGITSSPDEFFCEDKVTFTSIYRAKGNEGSMVYIMDAHNCNSPWELAKKRNILFTAMTRTKAWLRVCGIGDLFSQLEQEYRAVVKNNFQLFFKYPNEKERKTMRIVNRDMTKSERRRVTQAVRKLEDVNNLLDNDVNLEDIPEELRNALLKKLQS